MLAEKVHLPIAGSPKQGPTAKVRDFKPSRYNIFVTEAEHVWAFNSRSTALARFTIDEFSTVRRLLDDGFNAPDEKGEVSSFLLRGGFLVERAVDELESLKLENRLTRFGTRGPGFVIAPTLRCNFECPYCYVDLNANNMAAEARQRVKRFFDRKLQPDGGAAICWTGGDPSLAMEVVADLSEHFIGQCDSRGGVYDAVMITNGYRLDEEMLRGVHAARIHALQITLDGNREAHNERRHTHNHGPTYDRILDNVERAAESLLINLRINVDRANAGGIDDIFRDLQHRGLTERVRFYLANLEAVNEHCSGYDPRCFSTTEFASVETELLRRAFDLGLRTSGDPLRMTRQEYCGANSTNYYVIDPAAQLLKCYTDLGTADRNGIGYISEDGVEMFDKKANLVRWLGWDPFEIQECRDCDVLPLCMGGCSYARVRHGPGAELGCLTMRYNKSEVISLYGQRGLNNGVRNASCSIGCGPK
jgi:uncharacterized protein